MPDETYDELILRCVGGSCPVVTNALFRHTEAKIPLPPGAVAEIDLAGAQLSLRYLEDPVTPR